MKATGTVRKIDQLGRVVLPIELRKNLNIDIKDSIEIYVDDEHIFLKKYMNTCIFCGSIDKLIDYKNKKICENCKNNMADYIE